MARPVTGFLTNTGQYFEREEDAKRYEAIGAFNEALDAALAGKGLPPMLADFFRDNMRHFVIANRDVVLDYVALVQEVPELPAHDIRAPEAPIVRDQIPLDMPDEELELIDIEPDTGPVSDPPELEDDDDGGSDFISAFEQGSVGDTVRTAEAHGNDEVLRQPEPSLSDVHQ